VKFKIDENLPFLLKNLIEKGGDFTVDSVYHEGLKGISDEHLLDLCLKEKRVLITLDTDFINTSRPNYGIIILRSRRQGKNAIKSIFSNFISNFDLKNSKNRIVIVESTNIRIRFTHSY
jgi:predicted nuclease of predicted toxin-antitoxin system